MTVNTTLAHSAIKSLRHAQECMIAIEAEDWFPVANILETHIRDLELFLADEVLETNKERTERGE